MSVTVEGIENCVTKSFADHLVTLRSRVKKQMMIIKRVTRHTFRDEAHEERKKQGTKAG